MSASEKLRRLEQERLPERIAILDALPALIAVVKAAEKKAHLDDVGFLTGLNHPTPCALCVALASLDEALGEQA